ncbi:two-component system sensor histidine kinase YesM [Hydrogenispora ethanolica]|uniref:histidine kinase n=1 Tax=Hydrogenispora ethanolica TaxID=1082276 RepID=A0A4R1S731_HYDET|nr:sensor histidine kinase [Hydrogenispora ethanolica]TCL75118.1 two-component system sensor histidine kinase YesM [Hydrogenispora ethanolica]
MLHGYNIRNKLIFFFLLVILIPSILITTVMYLRSTRLLGEKKGDSIVNSLEQTCRVIDTILKDAEYQLTFLTIYPENLGQLNHVTRQPDYFQDLLAMKIWTRLRNFRISNQNILAIYIYLYRPRLMLTSFDNRRVIEVNRPGDYQWLNRPVDAATGQSEWAAANVMGSNINDTGVYSFVVTKNIKSIDMKQPIGVACIALEEHYFRHNLLDSIREGARGTVMLLDGRGALLSASGDRKVYSQELRSQSYVRTLLNGARESFIAEVNGEKMLIGYTTSPYTGWKYVSMEPIREVVLNTVEIRNLAIWVNLLSISLAVFLAFLFSQSIYRPIRVLKDSMKQVESGNLTVQIPGARQDEFGMLNRGFNRMINQIQRLIDELYHEKLLKKEAELKSLQAQINPHFLYNTLDSIHWLSRFHKLDEVSQLTFALSNFYRLSLASGRETVTVAETIALIQEYLKIQKIRYGDKIAVEVEADPAMLQYPVLPMIIQPLVENAIGHGIEKKKGPGRIRVALEGCDGGMVFTVQDNGLGIAPEKLRRIQRQLQGCRDENGESFALLNIHRRIRLCYGKPFGLTIDSEPGRGTVVRVFLPRLEHSKPEEAEADV